MRSVSSMALAASVLLAGCSSGLMKITKTGAQTPPSAASPSPRVPATPPATPVVSAPADRFDLEPAPVASDSAGVERLVQLATIWSAVAHFHPFVEARGIAWDSALVRAVPTVRAAGSAEELRAAIATFVQVLGDPVTGFVQASSVAAARGISSTLSPDRILMIAAPTDQLALQADAGVTLGAVALTARMLDRIVLDLRAASPQPGGPDERALRARINHVIDSSGLAAALTTSVLAVPYEQRRVVGAMYVDEIPPEFMIGGQPAAWRSVPPAWLAGTGRALLPAVEQGRGRNRRSPAPQPAGRQIVVVVNEHTIIPDGVLALVSSGEAALYAEGSFPETALTSRVEFSVPGAGALQLRTGVLVNADGSTGIRIDSTFTVPAGIDSTAPSIRAALATIRAGRTPNMPARAARSPATIPAAFDTAAYPTMGARLLGVFRLWSAMRTLHAHRDSYDDDLDEVFRRAIRQAESARDAREYAKALLDLATSSDDSGVRLHGASVDVLRGEYAVPFTLRWIEGRPIVTQLATDPAQRAPDISVGDEITAVEGLPAAAWVIETSRAGPASNEWMRLQLQMESMRRGPATSMRLRVRDARGVERTVNVPRSLRHDDSSAFVRYAMAPVRDLGNGVRYIDGRLPSSEPVTAVGARAILIDLRGQLAANPDSLTRMARSGFAAARTVRRGASIPCFAATLRDAQAECIDERSTRSTAPGAEGATAFSGPIVVLVDERTDGAGELLALQLESGGAILAGTPTAGAAAATSRLRLPGGVFVEVPLEEVRRGDGAQLHRVGLSPRVEIRPSILGARNGVDDVLQRALQWVQQELDQSSRRRR